MIYGIAIIILTAVIAFSMISANTRLNNNDKKLLQNLYFFHLFMGFVYFTYVQFNRSDSRGYFRAVIFDEKGINWFDYFSPGTPFVEWSIWPFIKFFGFTYEASMALFCFFGFIGFYFYFLFFKERIKFKHQFFGVDLLTIFLFLPNMHFWTGSLGKGSLIFMGIGMFTYGLNKFNTRWVPLLLGAFIIWGIRVPILLVMVMGAAIGFFIGAKKLSGGQKALGIIVGIVGLVYSAQFTSSFLQLDEINDVGAYFDNRGNELSRNAGSGVNIQNYNFVQKIFTFLYRPLFIDGVNALGLVVSVENLFLLIMTFKLFSVKAIKYLLKADYMVKMSIIAYIGASFGLSSIAGNLGIVIRLKTMIVYFMLFVVIQYMDDEKMKKYIRFKKWQRKKQRMEELRGAA